MYITWVLFYIFMYKLNGIQVLRFTYSVLSYMCSNVKSLISQDCEDHAILLCSLLLGFGLDAYVCVGTKSKGSVHAWVATISIEGTVVFWESLNGHRYVW